MNDLCHATLLDRADTAEVVLEPFPHIVIRNALPEEEYARLSAAFPTLDALPRELAESNNKRFNLFASWGPTELPAEDVPPVWKAFLDAHSAPSFSRKVFDIFSGAVEPADAEGRRPLNLDVFGPALDERLSLDGPVFDEDIIARTTVGINTPCRSATSVRGPHTDSVWKAYVGLYYIRDEKDDSDGGDLRLYRWKDGKKGDLWPMQVDEAAVEQFQEIRYAPNTYVLMLNTHNSLHGVSVRNPTPHVRRFAVTSGFFPGVDEKQLLGRRRSLLERARAWLSARSGQGMATPAD